MRTALQTALDTLINEGWANETHGSVDDLIGHVALIDLTTEREMLAEVIDGPPPPPAWYVVVTTTTGMIHAYPYPTEAAARRGYRRAVVGEVI